MHKAINISTHTPKFMGRNSWQKNSGRNGQKFHAFYRKRNFILVIKKSLQCSGSPTTIFYTLRVSRVYTPFRSFLISQSNIIKKILALFPKSRGMSTDNVTSSPSSDQILECI